jgi:hypothetical protein
MDGAHRPREQHAREGRVLHPEPVVADHRLQGPTPRRAARRLLHGAARPRDGERARDGAPALQHQHVPHVGARAALPHARPQRRDQHGARQRCLDERARAALRRGGVRGGRAPHHAHHRARRLRLRSARQRGGAAPPRRSLAPARDDDAGAGGLAERPADVAEEAGVLRVPLLPGRAVGRPRRPRLHRRQAHRRHPRSQRPPPRALDRHEGRHGRARVGDGRPRDPAGERGAQGPPRAGPHVPGRHGSRPHRRGRGAEGRDLAPEAVRPLVAREQDRALLDRRVAAHRHSPRARVARSATEGLRLHGGGPALPHGAHGGERRGSRRLDGHGHPARGALRRASAPLQLLQAALRPGHEPRDRPDPRGARDEPEAVHRRGSRAAARATRPCAANPRR